MRGIRARIRKKARIALGRPVGLRLEKFSVDEQFPLDPFLDVRSEDVRANAELMERWHATETRDVRTATWLVPYFAHAYFGGIYTIFRFIDGFARRGVTNRVVIYDVAPQIASPEEMQRRIVDAFPALEGTEVVVGMEGHDWDRLAHLPPTDIGIATLWTSAYALAKWQGVQGKYYFVQDFEPEFYVAGSAYALAEQTYRFGFDGIVNTPGLAESYRAYGNKAVSFVPSIDKSIYFPPERKPDGPVRVVFYARPTTARNGFGIGVAALSKLKAKYGDHVDIVAAGEEWNPADYGLAGVIRSAGLLPGHEAVADLYRSAHIGLVFMMTRHPSYQPFEYMACGVATVTNRNQATDWFFRDGENSLVSEPTATSVFERLCRLVEDEELRDRIASGGLATVDATDWESNIDKIWGFVTTGDRVTAADGVSV